MKVFEIPFLIMLFVFIFVILNYLFGLTNVFPEITNMSKTYQVVNETYTSLSETISGGFNIIDFARSIILAITTIFRLLIGAISDLLMVLAMLGIPMWGQMLIIGIFMFIVVYGVIQILAQTPPRLYK
ncbi:MAG: hypothetical protein QXI77_03490 [Nanopusillaceae archaeon]